MIGLGKKKLNAKAQGCKDAKKIPGNAELTAENAEEMQGKYDDHL